MNGYCRGGEHYIGDADECERCDEYERLMIYERLMAEQQTDDE